MSLDGVKIDLDKIEKIETWPTKHTGTKNKIYWIAEYYGRFIKKISQIAMPLTEIMPTPV